MSKLNKIYVLAALFLVLIVSLIVAAVPILKLSLNSARFSNERRQQVIPKQSVPPQPAGKPEPPKASTFDLTTEEGKFEHKIHQLLMARQFAKIDNIAREVRTTKKRFPNGRWAIRALYVPLMEIFSEKPDQAETDSSWKNRIAVLQSWEKQFPISATAKIALAKAWTSYGWFARGDGYINTVSEENLRLLEERLYLAEKELLEARDLDEKCPEWYSEKLFLAMATGVPTAEFNALFDEAISFEPNYVPFYAIKSDNLTPRWGGRPGEWQEFIDSIPETVEKLGSDEGNIIYFIIVMDKMRDNTVVSDYSVFSKDRIKQGFEDLSQKYKTDDFVLNKYAFLSVLTLNKPAAAEAFKRIGDNPNPAVWSKEYYKNVKKQSESGVFSDSNSSATN
jgi:hypothetical protein